MGEELFDVITYDPLGKLPKRLLLRHGAPCEGLNIVSVITGKLHNDCEWCDNLKMRIASRVIGVPVEYRESFRLDGGQALRDIARVATVREERGG